MYNPSPFKKSDMTKLHDFIEKYSFATIITNLGSRTIVSHLPLLLDRSRGKFGTLIGHLARANPQWKTFSENQNITCLFHGPHGYISAGWYVENVDVPTWNYAVVHVKGSGKLIEDSKSIDRILKATVDLHEQNLKPQWKFNMPEREKAELISVIVGFEIEISEIEGKLKLSQNRTEKDRQAVILALSEQQDDNSKALVAMMKNETL
jgi:transcriptional regulator